MSRALARARGAASPVRDRREMKIRLPKENHFGERRDASTRARG